MMSIPASAPDAQVSTKQLYDGKREPIGSLVVVTGDFRQASRNGLTAELGARLGTQHKLILDLSKSQLTGDAFSVLAQFFVAVQPHASQVKLVTQNADTLKRLQLFGLLGKDRFEVFRSVDEACAALV